MYDTTATLMHETGRTYDAYGNEILTYEPREVFAYQRSVYNAEFYRAAQVGLHPSITLILTNKADYDGETYIVFEGKEYNVIRADWTAQRDSISLILEERINVYTPPTTTETVTTETVTTETTTEGGNE